MSATQHILRQHKATDTNVKVSKVKQLREEYDLTVIQAAAALGTNSGNIELWESDIELGPGENFLRSRFEDFVRKNSASSVSNMLFSVYPLKLAREILDLTIEDIAQEYGDYSKSAWQKFESNDRVLDRKILLRIEDKVRTHFSNACKLASR
jgi:transcriptional regulator with XRE-family HTH domain